MTTQAPIPGNITGAWTIDPRNSEVSFTVRYLGVSKVHGRFNRVSGEIVTRESAADSSVSATVGADSIDTGFAARDEYIKSSDVLAAAEHKELTFTSTGIRDGCFIDGDLTIHGVTRPVTLTAKLGGYAEDPAEGGTVLGASATMTLDRKAFGFAGKIPSAVIGDKITVHIDIQATLKYIAEN